MRAAPLPRQTCVWLLYGGAFCGGVVLHVWASWDGFFYMDDFAGLAAAQGDVLDFATQTYNGHFTPAVNVILWISQAVSPMSWPLAVLVLSIWWIITLSVAVLLQRHLFGGSLWGVASVMFLSFAPLITTVSVWYSAGLQILPWAATFMATLYFAARYAQQSQWRWVVAASASFLIGLMFWQKALLFVPVVLWLYLRYWPGTGRFGLRGLGVRWAMPIALLVIGSVYALIYIMLDSASFVRSLPGRELYVESARIMLGEVWLPAYVGGPWSGYTGLTELSRGASSPSWVYVAIALLVLCLIALSVARWRIAWNAWIIIAAYAALTVAFFAVGRLSALGVDAALDPRYVADLFVVGAVVLPFAFVRPAGSPCPEPHQVNLGLYSVNPAVYSWGLVALSGLLVVPSISVGKAWHNYPARKFVENIRELAVAKPGVVLLDRKVPQQIVSAFSLERANASAVLSGANLAITWNGAAPKILALNEDGSVRPITIDVSSESTPGPDGDCGYKVDGGTARVDLDSRLFDWTWIGEMNYLATERNNLWVALDGEDVSVPVSPGLGSVQFVVTGGGQTLNVTAPEGLIVCVESAVLGQDRSL